MFFKCLLPGFAALVLCFVTLAWGHHVIVLKNNLAFAQIQRGDRVENVIELMGNPREVAPFRNPANNKKVRFYTYCVYPFLIGENPIARHKWQIAVDESDRVVWTQYSDDAC